MVRYKKSLEAYVSDPQKYLKIKKKEDSKQQA